MAESEQPSLLQSTPPALTGIEVSASPTRSILTRATGFMAAYDYTLNPYSGCTFGCSYCYAAFFVRNEEAINAWGRWVTIKEQAADAIRRARRDLRGASIYMSSVTDPYQPIERQTGLTRTVLQALIPWQPQLVVQTRGPLVTRDIDLLRSFSNIRVNMTITTDTEAVRKAFESHCSSNTQRLNAATKLSSAGIPVGITMTPLLPVADPDAFAEAIAATGADRFVVQPFHMRTGRFVAGTRAGASAVAREMGWNRARYEQALAALRERLPTLVEGRDGFAP